MKKPSHKNIEAERMLLAIVLNDPARLDQIFMDVSESDFSSERYQAIFRVCRSLWKNSEPLDFATITDEARKLSLYEQSGGISTLTEIDKGFVSGCECGRYIEILREHSAARRCVQIGEALMKAADHPGEAIAEAMQGLALIGTEGRGTLADMSSTYEALRDYLKRVKEAGEPVDGIKTPFRRLNYYLGNFQNGEVIIFAARPGVGKSALVNQILIHTALYEGKRVALFSLEMSSLQILLRMFANLTDRTLYDFRKGIFDQDEIDCLIERLKPSGLMVDEQRSDLEEVCQACRIMKKKVGLDMICIDYLQLMTIKGEKRDRRTEVDTVSRALKLLAKELNVPIIALSQMNRSIEMTDREPTLSDLRESGAIEQDASQVVFLHRNKAKERSLQYAPETERYLEVIVAKNRQGALGKLFMRFEADRMKFTEIEPDGQRLKALNPKQVQISDIEPYYGELPFDHEEERKYEN